MTDGRTDGQRAAYSSNYQNQDLVLRREPPRGVHQRQAAPRGGAVNNHTELAAEVQGDTTEQVHKGGQVAVSNQGGHPVPKDSAAERAKYDKEIT